MMGLGVATTVLVTALGLPFARAQTPTGTVTGVVSDSSGAAVNGARVTVTNRDTTQHRTTETSADGRYNAEGLPPGAYALTVEASGFKTAARDAEVNAGLTTTSNFTLELGDVSEIVSVSGALPLVRTDQYQVAGVVGRDQIANLPLNGRNFLELAKLEPGVTTIVRGTNNRSFVPALGAGLQSTPRVGFTRITVDGGDASFVGAIGAGIQVSQDAVQEFQLSTVNFDASTGLTSNASVNIITRSGGTSYRGDGFVFYRDHNLAAYPALKRDASNPDPFFERRQIGSTFGGPLVADRAFVFASYERDSQQGVASIQPPQFPELGGVFATPYDGDLYTARVDVHLGGSHQTFVRYTRDANHAFAPAGGPGSTNTLPSAWSHLTNEVDQVLGAVTSTLTSAVVNDARVSYFFIDTPETPATAADCQSSVACLGVGGPRITIPNANLTIGSARTLAFRGGRFDVGDTLVWQRGAHRLRAGGEWEHSSNSSSLIDNDQAILTLFTPLQAQQARIPVPATYTTVGDLLQLPIHIVQTGVGSGSSLQRDFGSDRVVDLWRLFVADTWHAGSRVTLNAAVGWSYEPNALNDLTKPTLLTPILGPGGLAPPDSRTFRLAPELGLAWTPSADGKTVVRVGAGRYDDSLGGTNSVDLATERLSLSPLGTGRLTTSTTFPMTAGVTGAQALAMLDAMRAPLVAVLNPNNRDYSVRNIDLTKQSASLFDPGFEAPYAIHVGVGVQREIGHGIAVSGDVVWRRFVHTALNGIDYNRWDSGVPVIRKCDGALNDLSAVCSTGPMLFTNALGHARYQGVLVRAEKRLSRGSQFLVSYAFGSYTGTNGTGAGTGFNNDNWTENDGPLPTDIRHVLNVSGIVELPWRLQIAFSVAASSAPPFSAYVGSADFNRDGTMNDLLPGTTVNQFGRGLDKSDLERLVQQYNQQHAVHLAQPAAYQFNDGFFTQDLRLTRTIGLRRGHARVLLMLEAFNVFNTPNLTGYVADLTQPAFGQPTSRSTQIFGSGGPRAFQLAARFSF